MSSIFHGVAVLMTFTLPLPLLAKPTEATKRVSCAPKNGCRLLMRLRSQTGALKLEDIADGLAVANRVGEKIPAAIGLLLPSPGIDETYINSQLPPVTCRADLEELLGFGTIFLNAASKHWRSLARICQEAGVAFAFPANINVYITAPGRRASTRPHADHHDVLILQSEGCKRWQVFAPPQACSERFQKHPLYRGKGDDVLSKEELGEALLDVTLRPGECLFIPSGFPHATSTACEHGGEAPAASVHLTLGLSAADCGLTYHTSPAMTWLPCLWNPSEPRESMLILVESNPSHSRLMSPLARLAGQVLLEMGLEPFCEEELPEGVFWVLQRPVPLGCLAQGAARQDVVRHLATELRRVASELSRSSEVLEMGLWDAASLVASRWHDIWEDLLQIHHEGYEAVISAQAGGSVVATGLMGTSVFHSLPRPCNDGAFDGMEDEARSFVSACPVIVSPWLQGAADPFIVAATSSAAKFCEFIRARLPALELHLGLSGNLFLRVLTEHICK